MTRTTAPLTLFLLCFAGCSDAGSGAEDLEQLNSETCTACAGDCLIESFQVTQNDHVEGGVDYDDHPPVGGNHDSCWASYGVHDTEIAAENWVHNLEHGAIVLLYNCPDGCDEEVAVLSSVAASMPANTVLVSPYSLMESRFAATAWGWRMLLDCADNAEVFIDFYAEHYGNAPETTTAEPSTDCM